MGIEYLNHLHSTHVISRIRLPTAAAWVHARIWQVGFVVDEVASGPVFCEYYGFPFQTRSFHPGQLAEALRRADHPSKESCRLS
jgi:hypothetical protein